MYATRHPVTLWGSSWTSADEEQVSSNFLSCILKGAHDKLIFVCSASHSIMENIYRANVKSVFDAYVDAKLIPREREKEAIEACVQHLSALNVKVKLVPNEKKSAPAKMVFECTYQMVKNGIPTKSCGKVVKNPLSMYCDKHHSIESCEVPEKYLRVRFPNYKDKCIDITKTIRETEGINLHLNSSAAIYHIYIIRDVTPDYHALCYGESTKKLGWKHVLLGLLSVKKNCAFEMNADAMTGVSLSTRIPQADNTLGVRVRPGLQKLNKIFAEQIVKVE